MTRALNDLMVEYDTDKRADMHGYDVWYARHLDELREQPFRLLEIGIWEGGSLRTWADYFPQARIYGVDIAQRVTIDHPRITQVISDYRSCRFEGSFDVIIDDASHQATDIVAAFKLYWPLLSPGGWYIIEDLETQWEAGYGGNHVTSAARLLIQDLVEDAMRERSTRVAEAHVYRQIAFFRAKS